MAQVSQPPLTHTQVNTALFKATASWRSQSLQWLTSWETRPGKNTQREALRSLGLLLAPWQKPSERLCLFKTASRLPWWLSGKESACWCRRHSLDPWFGKIPPAREQLSPSPTTAEPVPLSPGSAATEALTPWVCAATKREATATRSLRTKLLRRPQWCSRNKACAATKTLFSQK